MAKSNFTKGDYVSCKKWSGAPFLGIYEHTYNDASHSVVDVSSGKRFNIHEDDIKMASEEEAKEIKKLSKQNNVKPMDNVPDTYTVGKPPKVITTPTATTIKVDEEDELEAAMEAIE